MDYKKAGVDIKAGYEVVNRVKKLAKSTFGKGVIGDIGFFGGLFALNKKEYKEPVLVSGADGVGTKIKLAFMTGTHDTIGIDAVAMCVNDVIVLGARPLFFLDYLALNKVKPDMVEKILKGVASGCKQAGCALIGGETAEMGDLYGKDEYDIAGFCVGIVERSKIINGSKISVGDKLIGLGSSGLHSNGFTLARKALFEMGGLDVRSSVASLKGSLGKKLLTPTKIYVKPVLELVKKFEILGMAHITGGGLPENVERILPKGKSAIIEPSRWARPAIFSLIEEKGNITKSEMFKAFNMGVGMALVVNPKIAQKVVDAAISLGEKAFLIGEIAEGDGKVIIR